MSSAPGGAGRGIVRLSGPGAWGIGKVVAVGGRWEARGASPCEVEVAAGVRVPGWVYVFAGPGSYTGEDLVELHVAGGGVVARMLLARVMALGARHAEAGEFTGRAYLNGRMDLTAAEGVASVVAASSEREARAARQLMAGELARRVRPVMDLVAETLALTEVGIDFSDEEVTFLSVAETEERISRAIELLDRLVAESARFERVAHEPAVVLVGRPNAGKSTLINALSGVERAVVSDEAGTTRDVLSAEVVLLRGVARVMDVAGVGEEVASYQLPVASEEGRIEAAMRERALRAVGEADVVVMVREVGDGRAFVDVGRGADLVVWTKGDLRRGQRSEVRGQESQTSAEADPTGRPVLVVSARTGEGMGELRARLDEVCFGGGVGDVLALNARHLAAIGGAREGLLAAREAAGSGRGELVALGLREALDRLGEILGVMPPDEVLGLVFSRFCIGK